MLPSSADSIVRCLKMVSSCGGGWFSPCRLVGKDVDILF
jgi:hypothetical protein